MFNLFRKLSLTHWILISMVVGTLIGYCFPETAQNLKPMSSIFLRMIKSLIAPLLFATLVIGICETIDFHEPDLTLIGLRLVHERNH